MAGKGFDAKAFLINHTEKVVLGTAGLLVLGCLLGSQWTPYKGTPEEITAKVSTSRAALKNHVWPEEEKLRFEMTQKRMPKQVVHDNLRSAIAVSQYEMSTRFIATPWQGKEPLREPSLLALEEAFATAGRVLIERPFDPTKVDEEGPDADPPMKGTEQPDDGAATDPAMAEPDDEFLTDRPVGGAATGLPGTQQASPMSEELPAHGAPAAAYSQKQEAPPAHGAMASHGAHGAYLAYGETMIVPVAGPKREAQGYYFTSVRAVFPLKEQIRKFQDAIHAKSESIAAYSFEVIDFNLERQELIGNTQNWTEWQPVDTQAAIDVLDQSMPAEPDIVSGTVTNNVITMPLLPRIFGTWRKYGSHPKIDNFELSDQDMQYEVEFQSRMLAAMRDQKKTEVKTGLKKRGFTNASLDSRALHAQVFGGSAFGSGYSIDGLPGASRRPLPGPAKRGAAADPNAVTMQKILATNDKDEQSRALVEYIKQRVTANGELLLFRYMDFTVESGKSYRYRVRLVLNNPNFGHLASEANGEVLVVEGETRTTEWSNVTEPVTIERDVHYFVKDVDSRSNKTKVAIYKWDTKLGTTVTADLDLYPGQHIAGAVKTTVIDPAKSTYDEGKLYEFTSSDVFVDTNSDISLDKTVHKDLKLPGGSKGDLLLPEEVLVVQANTGELAVLDPVRQAAEQKRLADNQTSQAKAFEPLKGIVQAPTADMLMMGDLANPYAQPTAKGGPKAKGGRARNPLAGSGMMGSGSGMMGSGSGMPSGGSRGRPTGNTP